MRSFAIVAVAVFAMLTAVPAFGQDGPFDADVFVGLDFSDRKDERQIPAVQLGAHGDYKILGPLFAGGSAHIQQNKAGEWDLQPDVSLEAGIELPRSLKAYVTLEDVFEEKERRAWGGGIHFRSTSTRAAVNRDNRWGLAVRIRNRGTGDSRVAFRFSDLDNGRLMIDMDAFTTPTGRLPARPVTMYSMKTRRLVARSSAASRRVLSYRPESRGFGQGALQDRGLELFPSHAPNNWARPGPVNGGTVTSNCSTWRVDILRRSVEESGFHTLVREGQIGTPSER